MDSDADTTTEEDVFSKVTVRFVLFLIFVKLSSV